MSPALAAILIGVAVLTPPQGVGVPMCLSKLVTGLPCPGCGLMRSVSCAAHGMPGESLRYHAFGIPVLAISVTVAASLLLPRGRRAALASEMRRRRAVLRPLYVALVAGFLAYGVVRMGCAAMEWGTWWQAAASKAPGER